MNQQLTEEQKQMVLDREKEQSIGSWWIAASGEKFGCCIIGKHPTNDDVIVIGTDGVTRNIDSFKLWYKYKKLIPKDGVPFGLIPNIFDKE